MLHGWTKNTLHYVKESRQYVPAREASRLSADLHFSFYSFKSNSPVSSATWEIKEKQTGEGHERKKKVHDLKVKIESVKKIQTETNPKIKN